MKHTYFSLKALLLTFLASSFLWYLMLPALNLKDSSFLLWSLLTLIIYFGILQIQDTVREYTGYYEFDFKDLSKPLIISLVSFLTFVFVVPFISSSVFNANKYANIISIEEKSFDEFPVSNLNKLALLDRNSAKKIGDSYLGSIEKVSQFDISKEYRQITIKDQPYRVSPLQYSGFFKWLNNRNEGIEYYVKVNQTNGKTELVKLKEGIKYSSSSYFTDDIKLALRLRYPSEIFGDPSFEVDDEGNPWYVATTYEPKVFWKAHDPNGVILFNPVTGKGEKYNLDQVPKWVDRVYGADNIIERIDDHYFYHKGFWNTVFSKEGIKTTTDEYNYLTIDSDTYLYTGLTSINSDSSNLGFILSNMRTRETTFYKLPSATEKSAMSSAEGEVQEKDYSATAPILVKLSGKGYYLVSLKDKAGLVKSYALVNAEDYQEVVIDTDVKNLISKFTDEDLSELKTVSTNTDGNVEETKIVNISGTINKIKTQVVNGTTIYYIEIDGNIYKIEANSKTLDKLPFIEVGTIISGNLEKDNFLSSVEIK